MKNITVVPAVIASLILLLLFAGMSYYDKITSAAVAVGNDPKRNLQLVDTICVDNTAKFIFKNIGGHPVHTTNDLFKEVNNKNVGTCESCRITDIVQPGQFVQGYCYKCPSGQHVFQIDASEQTIIQLNC